MPRATARTARRDAQAISQRKSCAPNASGASRKPILKRELPQSAAEGFLRSNVQPPIGLQSGGNEASAGR
jgi:hypothetical protein